MNVTDVNDNDPVFDGDQPAWHIPENTLPVKHYKVHASDIDKGENSTVKYEILNNVESKL